MAARLGLRVRYFSTSGVRPVSKLIKPPVQVYGVAGRYATAVYSAASKQKTLDQVEKELGRIKTLMKDPKVSSIVTNPHIKSAVKQKAMTDVLVKEKCSPLTINFVGLLAQNGRLPQAIDVVVAFEKMMSAHRGGVLCSVTTAQPLDEGNLTELKSVLNSFLKKGEVLKLDSKTDTSILGGMIVSIGDKYVDMSAKTKIQKLSKIMKQTV
uniref:Oligomycin sensitivity conferral protein n=1 Tax=Callorhinchus milii TaxID=7868 RepID=K4FT45_CALMI|nr:ATP synthase, H+ transporting, mitochondrial F1 complex, O subunit [Callorhinchus milii]